MFGATMLNEANCRGLLERVLEIPIGSIEVDREKNIVYHPEFKGIRLDVYAKDDSNRRFNVEMQIFREPSPGKRSRYYHSQIDMDLLLTGMMYEQLPDTYVIFICDFDPFYAGKYRYVFRNICIEDESIHLQDGSWTIFLNTKGKKEDEISKELLNLLRFIGANLEESQKDYQDSYIKQLQDSIASIKRDREMGKRYMLIEEYLMRERQRSIEKGIATGTARSIISIISKNETIPDALSTYIMNETNLQTLEHWLELAISADSIENFMNHIHFTI